MIFLKSVSVFLILMGSTSVSIHIVNKYLYTKKKNPFLCG